MHSSMDSNQLCSSNRVGRWKKKNRTIAQLLLPIATDSNPYSSMSANLKFTDRFSHRPIYRAMIYPSVHVNLQWSYYQCNLLISLPLNRHHTQDQEWDQLQSHYNFFNLAPVKRKPRSGRFNECRSTNNCTHISETLTDVKPTVSLPAAINCCHRHPVNHTHHYRRSTPFTIAASSASHLSDSWQPTDSFSFSPTPTLHFCAHFSFFHWQCSLFVARSAFGFRWLRFFHNDLGIWAENFG